MKQVVSLTLKGVKIEKQYDESGILMAVRLSCGKGLRVTTTWIEIRYHRDWIQVAINNLNRLREATGWLPLDDLQVAVVRTHLRQP